MPWTRSVRRRHNHCKSTANKHNQRRQDAQMSSKSEAIERKIEVMKAEGVVFRTGVNVGVYVKADELKKEFDRRKKQTVAQGKQKRPVRPVQKS